MGDSRNNLRSANLLDRLQKTCRKFLQFRHIFLRDIGKSHSGSIMFFPIAQLRVNPNHLNSHFDGIQSRFGREKKFDLQVLADLHLFRKKNLQSTFTGIQGVASSIDWRVGSIILNRKTHWKSAVCSSFKINDPITGFDFFLFRFHQNPFTEYCEINKLTVPTY